MNRRRFSCNGITLFEALMSVAILGVTYMVGASFAKYLTNIGKNNADVETNRIVQENLYEIVKEIRNSRRLISISTVTAPLSISFETFDFSLPFSSPNMIFDQARIGTITYQFIDDPAGSYLLRTAVYQNRRSQSRLLPKLLQPDDPSTPNPDPIFNTVPGYDGLTPISLLRDVDITFRVAQGWTNDKHIRVYKAESMVRTGRQ